MIGKYDIISSDLFNISKRIKKIDGGYFIAYSYKMRRFEVHNSRQRGGSFCLAVPFDRLDARVLDLVKQTKSENADKIFKKIESDNERLLKENRYKAIKDAEIKMENLLSNI